MKKIKRPTLLQTQMVEPFKFRRNRPQRVRTQFLVQEGNSIEPVTGLSVKEKVFIGLIGILALAVLALAVVMLVMLLTKS